METHIAIIMGSAVLPDGRPSATMRRRVKAALDLRHEFKDLLFLPTGGNKQRWGRSEAEVMKRLLKDAGGDNDNTIEETDSKNTLQSITYCTRKIKELPDVVTVVVCSDSFHLPRCRLLLSILGIHSNHRAMPGGRKSLGFTRWSYYCAREAVAIPVDVVLLLFFRILGKTA
jgi:vancomycin permeability regulator SanA